MQELSLTVQAQINYHLSTAQPCFKVYLFAVSKGRGGGSVVNVVCYCSRFSYVYSMILTLRG